MRVAVTGAAGHLGGALVRELLARGAEVRALVHRDRRAIEGLGVEIHEGDVTDAAAVARLVDGCERVFHLAAVISLEPRDEPVMQAINVGGVRVVVDACLAAGARLIHTSSIHAFSALPRDGVVDETRGPAEPHAPAYDRSKAAGEAIVRAARGLDAVIVNPTAIIGPYDFRPSPMGEVMLDLAHGRMPGLVAGGFDWVDVRDVVAGMLAAAERGQRGASYLLSGEWHSVVELADRIAAITGVRRPRFVSPMWLARFAAPFAVGWARLRKKRALFTPTSLVALRNHQRISSERARRELGYSTRPVADTLRDAFAWFEANGMFARRAMLGA